MTYLTQDRAQTLLKYDPQTGHFTWRENRPGGRGKIGKRAGYMHHTGYRYVRLDGFTVIEHRLAWFYVYGFWPKNDLDHVNRVRHDNRIENLRETTRAENCQNQPVRKSNKSGVTGVYFHKASGKWAVYISVNKKQLHLGVYDTLDEAVSARHNAEKEHYPHANTHI